MSIRNGSCLQSGLHGNIQVSSCLLVSVLLLGRATRSRILAILPEALKSNRSSTINLEFIDVKVPKS
jgi:hypothetical protein